MKILLIISLLLVPKSWDETDYETHTADSFFALKEVQNFINPKELNVELLEAAIFYASNEVRAEQKLPLYDFDPRLQKAARFHSNNMMKYEFVGHTFRKKREYRDPYDRIVAFNGSDFKGVAENVARVNVLILGKNGQFSISSKGKLTDENGKPLVARTYAQLAHHVLKEWMNSPGHRKNLLDNYNYLGCGVSAIDYTDEGLPQLYLTQNFARK